MTTLPAVHVPLDVLVARCRLPVRVSYNMMTTIYNDRVSRYDSYSMDRTHTEGPWSWTSDNIGTTPMQATRAYTALRDRLMAERGQITDQNV